MSDPKMIPPEVVEAAAVTLMGRMMVSHQDALHVWSGMHEPEKNQFRREARAAITAALKAWPGMDVERFMPDSGPYTIHLPLPKGGDDE